MQDYRPYACKVCGKEFPSQPSHVKIVSTQVILYLAAKIQDKKEWFALALDLRSKYKCREFRCYWSACCPT